MAGRLEIPTAWSQDGEDASPGTDGYWSEAFQRLVGTLWLRATMHAELSGGGAERAAATDQTEIRRRVDGRWR